MKPSTFNLPRKVQVTIEVRKGSHVKRGSAGGVDFLSPVPCPWNYGSAIGHMGPDGEPVDVVVLGPPLPRGTVQEVEIRGRIPFIDDGLQDDKWIGSDTPLCPDQVEQLETFFRTYARAKQWARKLRRSSGDTKAGIYTPLGPPISS